MSTDWPQGEYAQAVTAFREGDANGVLQAVEAQIDRATAAAKPPAEIVTFESFDPNSRPLDTDYVISTTRDALVNYSIQLGISTTVGANTTAAAAIDLYTDGVVQSRVANYFTSTLPLGVAITQTLFAVLSAYIRAGSTVRLVLSTQGTADAFIVTGQEVLL